MRATGDTTPPRPLHGRDTELGDLVAVLDGARRGMSGALLVTGEAGAGKSALLDQLTGTADDCRTLRTVGVEEESGLPFAGLHQLLGTELHRLSRLPEPQRRALDGALGLADGGQHNPFLIGAAVLGLLAELAATGPVLMCLDDVQWLDEPSMRALGFAARRLDQGHGGGQAAEVQGGIAFVAASRPHSAVAGVPGGVGTRELRPLDNISCAALLAERTMIRVPASVATELAEGTGGNPLALVELSTLLSADQLAGRASLPDPLPAGARTEAAYGRRAAEVSEEVGQFLLIAAAAESGDCALLSRAAGAAGLGSDALDLAEATGLVTAGPARLRFRHPLIRSVVYHSAPQVARRAAHRAIACAHERPENAGQRAWHRAATVLGPTETVAAELEIAAAHARVRGGFPTSARMLERAAWLTPDAGGRSRRFLAAAADAGAAGRPGHALWLIEHADRLAPESHPAGQIEWLRGELELRGGVVADAYAVLMIAAARLAPTAPMDALEALAAAGEAAGYAGDVGKLVAAGSRARSLELDGDSTEHRILLGLLQGSSEVFSGSVAAGTARLREAIACSDDLPDLPQRPRLLARLAQAATLAGDDAQAHTLAYRAVDVARSTGALAAVPHALEYLVGTEIFRGAYESAEAHAVEGIGVAEASGHHNSACHLRAGLALIAAFRGDERGCRRAAALALRTATAHGLGLPAGLANWALGMIDLGLGRSAGAAQRLTAIAGAGPGAGHPVVALLSIPHRVEALVRHDPLDLTDAREAAAAFTAWAEQVQQPWALALSARCAAMLAGEAEAEGHYRRALELHGQSGRPFDRARTELQYGELLRRNRSRAQARVQLRSAWETLDRLGSGLWERRASAELRATGETVTSPAPHSPSHARLTAQELRIARLVAHGATNREVAAQLFLSPRTVDYHLRKVFHRLGITSRVELAHLDELRGTVPDAGS